VTVLYPGGDVPRCNINLTCGSTDKCICQDHDAMALPKMCPEIDLVELTSHKVGVFDSKLSLGYKRNGPSESASTPSYV
jgi:hypothetical protein